MKANYLINKNEITATKADDVRRQVVELLDRCYPTANSDDEAASMLKEWGCEGEMRDEIAQKFSLPGEMDGDFQKTITVTIYGCFVDSGSDDYIYTVYVTEA